MVKSTIPENGHICSHGSFEILLQSYIEVEAVIWLDY